MRDKWSCLSPRRSSTTRLPVSVASVNGKIVLHWPRMSQDSGFDSSHLDLTDPALHGTGRSIPAWAKVIKGNPIFFRGTSLMPRVQLAMKIDPDGPRLFPATRGGERHYTQLVAAFATPFFRFLALPLIVIFHRLPGRHANAYHR